MQEKSAYNIFSYTCDITEKWESPILMVVHLQLGAPKKKKGIYPKAMEMFYPNFSHDLRAPQKFICSKNNIYGIIPLM